MDYDALKKELKDIAAIADSVPDAYKVKCFEVLLDGLLNRGHSGPAAVIQANSLEQPAETQPAPAAAHAPAGSEFPMPTQLRLLMQRTSLSVDELKKVVLVADSEVHFIKEPKGKKIAEGQIAWTLLLALKNCILNDSLTVDPEGVRSICQEKGFYDRANFSAVFKRQPYARLFKGRMEQQGQARPLTTDGQAELATLVQQLAAQP